MQYIHISPKSKVPKYKQIVNSILYAIQNGEFKRGDQLPSINTLSEEYYLSRDTVEKAYIELRKRGIISSARGKGYYIETLEVKNKLKIFLLLNKLSAYKKNIYDSFISTLGDNATVDLFIYHNEVKIFESLLAEHAGDYDYYVVTPHFYDLNANILQTLKSIPSEKLLILDKKMEGLGDGYPSVYQNYNKDINNVLHSCTDLLQKYKKLKLVIPIASYHPREIIKGFVIFCKQLSFDYSIIDRVEDEPVEKGQAFIVVEERDLVKLIKIARAQKLTLGSDIGIISYNETPLKEVLADGVTVISTNFRKMGETAANMILEKRKDWVENEFLIIRRNTL